ncbi:DUF4012 domain-containing protein [Micromonospora siamensis]|uniref:DUF4012 domain-containing protein n=1 Tax=Micromonospora siamensis TaxID=299152 RepID=A0A1C5IT30_9ACTN|nr:DUF4012 domain-containing protein [Micromonospora siamensis]SCG61484.1 Protein of unknown function [Micromonospora siamensis]
MTEKGVSHRRRSRRRRRARIRRALLASLVVGSLVLLGVGWVGFRGWQARAHLMNAAGLARELSADVVAGDVDRAQRTLAALQEQSAKARSATGDPGWWLGEHAPWAGDDLNAVRQISVAIDELARGAFPSLLRTDLASLVPRGGRLDLGRLTAVSGELTAADRVVREVRARLAAVPQESLVSQIREALGALSTEMDRLAELTGAADRGAKLLPPLLGADGPRSYLLLSQNLAELRATGGMFGAYAVIRAEGGRIRMVEQGTSAKIGRFVPPLEVPAQTRALWNDLPGMYPADVNLTPHFPTAAALYREMYRRRGGSAVDGVLAVDPVMLSYLLKAIGTVSVPGGPALTGDHAVRTLLSDAYRDLDEEEQDGYFAAAAAAVFDALFTRNVDPRTLLSAFDRSITEGRVLFWSARPEEQRMLDDSRLTGTLPEKDAVPTVGVYLNDGSGAKLGYYVRPAATLTVGDCRTDGRRELRLRFTLHSTAPASGLSKSVLGLGRSGDPYTIRTLVSVYSPTGGTVVDGRLDGEQIGLGSGYDRRRQIAVANVEVPPGRTRTLDVGLLTGKTSAGAAELRTTPTATPWTTQVVTAPSCEQ